MKFFFHLLIVASVALNAQCQVVKFISSSPNPFGPAQLTTVLFQYEVKSGMFSHEAQLLSSDYCSKLIEPTCDGKRYLIAGLSYSPYSLLIVRLSTSEKCEIESTLYEISRGDSFLDVMYLSNSSMDNAVLINTVGDDKETKEKKYGINCVDVASLKINQVDTPVRKYIMRQGGFGVFDTMNVAFFYSMNEQGMVTGPDEIDALMPIVPKDLVVMNSLLRLQASNVSYLILTPSKKQNSVPDDEKRFILLDRESNRWSKWEVKGARSEIRLFNQYAAGYVAYSGYDEEKVNKGEFNPGRANRIIHEVTGRLNIKYAFDFDYHAKDAGCHAPGILFVKNLKTDEYYEYDTQQADSEILLINDDGVYWRKHDAIYHCVLKDGTLADHQLLYKGEEVPHIHWAFIASEN